MTLADFTQAPWQRSHEVYQRSPLSMAPAPEYANSEVLVASLYRVIGFGIGESSVSQTGRELEQRLQKLRDRRGVAPKETTLDVEEWNTVLHGVLESPKLPNQSAQRFLQVTPLVPALAPFSGAARLKGSPWSPGNLIRRMVWLGSPNHDAAQALWSSLFSALSIEAKDDVFARWLEKEVLPWSAGNPWQEAPVPPGEVSTLLDSDFSSMSFMPAKQFTKDLKALIQVKHAMTRRQWTSLLESILRIATVTHVAWLCDIQDRLWRCLSDVVEGKGPSGDLDARNRIFPNAAPYMAFGGKALQGLKDKASSYLSARLGINALLWSLDDLDFPYQGTIGSSKEVARLCEHVRVHRQSLIEAGFTTQVAEIREQEAKVLGCKKGIGSNLLEFARHVLGQRQTAIQLLKGYDQGYILKKRGASNSSPWIVSLGPVAVLALVHCALAGMGGARSVHKLGDHLAAYGIAVDRTDIPRNDLGNQLRMLGLVLDSPDAESGMLLIPPFEASLAMDKKE
ncbi:hypothetical protein [Achromobacter marplatensis]|uniref:Uncharacterized protein n=1 Tax=Achromobacter marplatensis TaxID=470868 RepID=A0AA42WFT4_9BURK|nr:hypothetical protein [Achromobacter marplatensis]MDH2053476.1 hypothetical protein [Achromobacter marplatensis]